MKILFICKHNRFRSKVGEAFMKRISQDSLKFSARTLKEINIQSSLKKLGGGGIEVRSAGVKLDKAYPYVAENVKIALREYGIDDVSDVSNLVTDEDKGWADKIIIVADNVDVRDFPSDNVIVWPAQDCDQSDLDRIKEIVKEIYEKVKGFMGENMAAKGL